MLSIFKKEINLFFSSLIGYIAIGVFLTLTWFVMWAAPNSNVMEYGVATMDGFFRSAPYIFMILIPAITMRSFAEEWQSGTIELLVTRPLTDWQIVLGKFFACLLLVTFSLLPTWIYFYTVNQLGDPVGNIDAGGVLGSYIGLLFLGGAFVAIGLFASSITKNQIVAFVVAVILCLVMYEVFGELSQLRMFFAKLDHLIDQLGIGYHYESISKGKIDSRDVIYFLSVIAAFIAMTKVSLESRKW